MGHQYRLTPTCKVIPSLRLCFRSCGGWDERFRGSWDSSGVRGLILDFCCMEKKNQYRGGWSTFLGEKIVFSLEVFLAVFRSGTRFYYRYRETNVSQGAVDVFLLNKPRCLYEVYSRRSCLLGARDKGFVLWALWSVSIWKSLSINITSARSLYSSPSLSAEDTENATDLRIKRVEWKRVCNACWAQTSLTFKKWRHSQKSTKICEFCC